MLRDVGLEDISDGRLYRENDMVKTDTNSCQGCKKICCIGMGRTIAVSYTHLDVYKRQGYKRLYAYASYGV